MDWSLWHPLDSVSYTNHTAGMPGIPTLPWAFPFFPLKAPKIIDEN